MARVEQKDETQVYVVSIYKTLSGRWAFRHPSGRSTNGSWASRAYAMKVAKKHGWTVKG